MGSDEIKKLLLILMLIFSIPSAHAAKVWLFVSVIYSPTNAVEPNAHAIAFETQRGCEEVRAAMTKEVEKSLAKSNHTNAIQKTKCIQGQVNVIYPEGSQ